MHIAIIHHRISYKGGLETRLFNYIKYFTNEGHQVTVICHKVSKEYKSEDKIQIVKMNLKYVPKKLRQTIFSNKVKKYLSKHQFDFSLSLGRTSGQDAVLAPSNHLGYLKALGRKPKKIHDFLQISSDKDSYKNSKIIFAASQMIKQELIELYEVEESKIKVLYPPIDIQKFDGNLKGKQDQLKEKFGMSPTKTSFLFVSTSHKRKGLPLLLQIFQKLEDHNMELFILGDKINTDQFKNIKYLGYTKNTNEIYAAADFTIHPAQHEAFGQIILESLESGTPVIVSENTGAKEILTNETGIVIEGYNVDKWVNELITLKEKKFNIPLNFASTNKLSLEDHCVKIIDYTNKITD